MLRKQPIGIINELIVRNNVRKIVSKTFDHIQYVPLEDDNKNIIVSSSLDGKTKKIIKLMLHLLQRENQKILIPPQLGTQFDTHTITPPQLS